jgi:hypothetical protein
VDQGEGIAGSQQDSKAFLAEMPVMRENFGDAFLTHCLHRHAVGQAVFLVRAGLIQGKTILKPLPGLRQHGNRWIGKNAVRLQGGDSAKLGGCDGGR